MHLNKEIKNKLLPFQIKHVENIAENLSQRFICIDGSDTGIGKTYVAIATALQLNMKPLIFCPRTIITYWQSIADLFGVNPLAIINYETICKGYYYKDKSYKKRIKCPYVTYKKDDKNMYEWNLPSNTMIIFDEVHRCCNSNTRISKLLMSFQNVYAKDKPLLMISATIVDDVTKFNTFGLLFKWYSNINWAPEWLRNKNYNPRKASQLIQEKLYPNYASRICVSDLGDLFPKRQITADCYTVDDPDEINDAHKNIISALNELKLKCNTTYKENALTKILRARQKIELCKIPLLIDLTEQYLDNGYSVVIFVNFTETLQQLSTKLGTKCTVFGEQTMKERMNNINEFIENRKRIIICNIHAGGESINLEDKYGDHPRVSLISPTWSSIKLIQALGRTHRSDAKSLSLNRIIYSAKTIEENMCLKINAKLGNLSTINDVDLEANA